MSRPLRIAIPIHSFEPGGVERTALNLAAAWAADPANAVTVVLGRRAGAMVAPELPYLARPEPIPTASWESLWLAWCLWRYLAANEADAVFCAGNTYAVVCAFAKLLRGKRCPPVAIKLSNDLARKDLPAPGRWAYRLWLRIQGRLFDHFVGMAGPMQGEIVEAMRVPPERVSVIEDPSLTEAQRTTLGAIDRSAPHDGPPRYLAIGRLAPQKNFPLLLRAFAQGAPDGATLTILGEGPERPALERLAAELGIAGRVTLAGHCNDTAPYLAAASALVLSSDYEGVPAVVLEGLAAGLPLVLTRCSVSIASLAGDGAFGLLVPVGDTAGFAKALGAIGDFAFDPAAARAFTARFTVATAAPRYRAVFAALAAARVAAGDDIAGESVNRGDSEGR